MPYQRIFKFAIIGGPRSGKKTFCRAISKSHFDEDYEDTIGLNVFSASFMREGEEVVLQLCSFNCRSGIAEEIRDAIHGAKGLIVLVDLTNDLAIQVTKECIKRLLIPTKKEVKFLCAAVVGTKADLGNQVVLDEMDLENIVGFVQENLEVDQTFMYLINATDKRTVTKVLKEVANRVIESQ